MLSSNGPEAATGQRHSIRIPLLFAGIVLLGGQSLVAQPIDTLVQQLWRTHPELRVFDFAYAADKQRGAQDSQRPDPELLLGYFLLPVETRTGAQRVRLGATQRLPWPGKLAARAALADAQALPQLEQRAARVLDLALRLRLAYYEAWRYQTRAEQLRTFIPIYAALERSSLARVESGTGSTVSVYQLGLDQQALAYRIETTRLRVRLPEATLAGLLQRDPRPMTYTLPVTQLDTARVRYYAAQLDQNHPRLRIYAAQRRIREAALAVNAYRIKPDFAVGLDYIQVYARDDVDVVGNGRDILGPRVGLRLPLERRAYRATAEEERLRLLQLEASAAATLLDLRTQIDRQLVSYRLAEREAQFIQQQLTTLSPALEVARAEYAEGRRTIEEVLRLEERSLNYRLQLTDNRHARAASVARLAHLLAVHPDQIRTDD